MISEASPRSANSTLCEEIRELGKAGFPSEERLVFVKLEKTSQWKKVPFC